MEKTLRLLLLLSGKRTYSLLEIQDRFEISERTAYRHLNQLENAGFVIERNKGRYRLMQNDTNTRDIQKLLHFSEEEAYLFLQALENLEFYDETKKRLLKKLHSLYDFKALLQSEKEGRLQRIQNISHAQKKKKQVILKKYRSSNSATVKDRLVEAFDFLEDYNSIWALDTEDKKVKSFKISRLSAVEITSIDWQREEMHKKPFIDIFRMSAEEPLIEITVEMNLTAYNLLREEYPLSKKYLKAITENGEYYKLQAPVASFHGIGRFVLGLLSHFKSIEPLEFRQYLQNELKAYSKQL